MQDRCGNKDRKSKDNERNAEKGRGYIRYIDDLLNAHLQSF